MLNPMEEVIPYILNLRVCTPMVRFPLMFKRPNKIVNIPQSTPFVWCGTLGNLQKQGIRTRPTVPETLLLQLSRLRSQRFPKVPHQTNGVDCGIFTILCPRMRQGISKQNSEHSTIHSICLVWYFREPLASQSGKLIIGAISQN